MAGALHTWAVSDFQEPSRRVVPEGLPAPAVSERPPPNLVPASSPSLRRIRDFGNSAGCRPEERRLRTWFVDLFHSFVARAWGDRPTVRRPRSGVPSGLGRWARR